MNPTTQLLYEMLTDEPTVTMEDWAGALKRLSGFPMPDCRQRVERLRRGAVRTINANGMSVYCLTRGGRVAGTAGREAAARRGNGDLKTHTLKRLDGVDDPQFIEWTRHLRNSGIGGIYRANDDLDAAVARGEITSGLGVLLLAATASADEPTDDAEGGDE